MQASTQYTRPSHTHARTWRSSSVPLTLTLTLALTLTLTLSLTLTLTLTLTLGTVERSGAAAFKAVVKPVEGAGSDGVSICNSAEEVRGT